MAATPGRGTPPCSPARVVPAGQGLRGLTGSVHRPRGNCSTPPTISRWSVSQLVSTTRRISSIELGKSESQPPVPNPTSPNISR